ncbi:MAG: hypothetical protein HY738_02255 [Bacteroidia bacterium]|nr:hypothetical protein [Bacteroidia bacterium]
MSSISGSITVKGHNTCGDGEIVTLAITVNSLPNANAGSDFAVCVGDSVTLNAIGGTTYNWNNSIINNIPFVPTATTTYTVTVTDDNGCTSIDNVTVTVNALPIADAGNNMAVCFGSQVTLSATGGISYSWSSGVTEYNIHGIMEFQIIFHSKRQQAQHIL